MCTPSIIPGYTLFAHARFSLDRTSKSCLYESHYPIAVPSPLSPCIVTTGQEKPQSKDIDKQVSYSKQDSQDILSLKVASKISFTQTPTPFLTQARTLQILLVVVQDSARFSSFRFKILLSVPHVLSHTCHELLLSCLSSELSQTKGMYISF